MEDKDKNINDKKSISNESDSINLSNRHKNQFYNNPVYHKKLIRSAEAISREYTQQINKIFKNRNLSTVLLSSFSESLQAVIKKVNLSYIVEDIGKVASSVQIKLDETIKATLLEAKGFPGYYKDIKFNSKLGGVANNLTSKYQRIKELDKIFYGYFSKNRIENMRKVGSRKINEYHIKRILKHAVEAYYRCHYALTVITLSTIGESIIQNKVNNYSEGRKQMKKKSPLYSLIDDLNNKDFVEDYFKDFVYYYIKDKDHVIVDAPSRHASAHGIYNKYPSRKSALNAILITDFIINLSQKDLVIK